MRCPKCNWNNPEGVTHCQKCNRPLDIIAADNTQAQPSDIHSMPESWKTRETRLYGESDPEAGQEVLKCPECSYPIMKDDECCPNCNAVLRAPKSPIHGDTVLDANFAGHQEKGSVSEHKSRATVLDSSFSPAFNSCDSQNSPEVKPASGIPQLFPVEISLPGGEDMVLRRGDIVTIDGKQYLLR